MNRIKISQILEHSVDDLVSLIGVSEIRAKEIYALADFQQIPSIGIEFARDLIFLGFYNLKELDGEDGAELVDNYEKKKGYRVDPCVEDQFRLAVDFANIEDYSKKWWDFTDSRKKYRARVGYPKDRPKLNWTALVSTRNEGS